MRAAGFLLFLAGVSGIVYFLRMDVSVEVPGAAETLYATGRVNNIGLMSDRQNGLIVSSVIAALGFVTVLITQNNDAGGNRKCPYCAEFIKQEAVVCRFCQRDLVNKEQPLSPSRVSGAESLSNPKPIPKNWQCRCGKTNADLVRNCSCGRVRGAVS